MGAYTKNGFKVGSLESMDYITATEALFLVEQEASQDDEIRLSLVDGSVFRFPYPSEDQCTSSVETLEMLIRERWESSPVEWFTYAIGSDDVNSCTRCSHGNGLSIVGQVLQNGNHPATVVACSGCGCKRLLTSIEARALLHLIANHYLDIAKQYPYRYDSISDPIRSVTDAVLPSFEYLDEFDPYRQAFNDIFSLKGA